jgi:hypothetical protein
MEAIEAHPDWDLDVTLKEQGIIKIRNLRYSSYADADQRGGTLLIKRVGPRQTSVQFDKESWGVVGGDEILKLIKQAQSRHFKAQGSQNLTIARIFSVISVLDEDQIWERSKKISSEEEKKSKNWLR